MLYAMHEKVEAELDRLVVKGTLKPGEYSDWAAPIVAVVKSDRESVRIQHMKQLHACASGTDGDRLYQLSNLINIRYSSMRQPAKTSLVINTYKGLFCYSCLPFGISSALGIFQKAMETLLQGIPHVTVYIF